MEREKSSPKRSRNDDRSNRDYDHHQRWSDQKSSGRDDRQNCREPKLSYGFRDDREGSRDEIDISRNPRIQIGSLNRERSGETEELAVPRLDANFNLDAVKRALEIAAKLGFRRNPKVARTKAPILRVDALGREIDSHGNVVNLVKPSNLSTLKVNINKRKREEFQILKPQFDIDLESNPYFDSRIGINKNKLLRPKRMTIQFVEQQGAQFGEAEAKELKPKQAKPSIMIKADDNPIPDVEWWDLPFLANGSYGDVAEDNLKLNKITIYVEHPYPYLEPPMKLTPPPQRAKLTKKEQKKLRTQQRMAREEDRKEMIRQGLAEPPKPKIGLSNLMRVLASEATQDPTKLEMEIRRAAAEHEQAHVDRNIARKLTPAERREKKERKMYGDPNSLETIVLVYKINDLSHGVTRLKVDLNAKQNRLTGCAVISNGMNVVVVEAGTKSINRYQKLMLRRIKWAKDVTDEHEDQDKSANKCILVWQGSVAKSSFQRFSVQDCITEAAARKESIQGRLMLSTEQNSKLNTSSARTGFRSRPAVPQA